MSSRKLHKVIGLILILPMLGWVFTGLIFFIKPGYQGAYEQLAVKTYPLEAPFTLHPDSSWQVLRLVRTVIGYHLLVTTADQVEHLDPVLLSVKAPPSRAQTRTLIEDAISANPLRYGNVVEVDANRALTSTGVEITLDWQNLRLSQRGRDTELINLMYKIHYLQWTPIKAINQVLGVLGMVLLIFLTGLGVRMYVKNKG
ncbi:PepSY domain-containing protein [Motilimonas sp. KMU-193]|uniref:PepSY domain-containing protein n=1 Tax=Motilimonas sp. KMU-193 TaxID=3388668 RepID=UPI00396B3D86